MHNTTAAASHKKPQRAYKQPPPPRKCEQRQANINLHNHTPGAFQHHQLRLSFRCISAPPMRDALVINLAAEVMAETVSNSSSVLPWLQSNQPKEGMRPGPSLGGILLGECRKRLMSFSSNFYRATGSISRYPVVSTDINRSGPGVIELFFAIATRSLIIQIRRKTLTLVCDVHESAMLWSHSSYAKSLTSTPAEFEVERIRD